MGSSPIRVAIYAEVAQLVEHHLAMVGVASSSLVFRSIFRRHSQVVRPRSAKPLFPSSILGVTSNAEIAQLVEHHLAKVGVASSSLVFRSIFLSCIFNHILVT